MSVRTNVQKALVKKLRQHGLRVSEEEFMRQNQAQHDWLEKNAVPQTEGGYLVSPKLRAEIVTRITQEPKKRKGWAIKMSHGGLAGAWLWPEGVPQQVAASVRRSRRAGIAVFNTRKQAREAINDLGGGRPVKVTVTVQEQTQTRRRLTCA